MTNKLLLILLLCWGSVAFAEGPTFMQNPSVQWNEPVNWSGNVPDSYDILYGPTNPPQAQIRSTPYTGETDQYRLEHLAVGQYYIAVRAVGLKNGESVRSGLSNVVPFMVVPESIGDGLTMLTAEHSGLPLQINDSSQVVGADLRQGPLTGGGHQAFRLTEVQAGIYRITVQHSQLCIGVEGASLNDGARLEQQTCDGSTSQQFAIGSSPTQIRNVYSQKCLDVPASITDPGIFIQQYSCHGGSNQTFLWSVQGQPLPSITGLTFE